MARRPAAGGRERRYDVDLLRIVCSLSVILLHTAGMLLQSLPQQDGGWARWVGLTGDTLGRFAVPVFFAMAGWAVLSASPPRSDSVLISRTVRILVPLALWTCVYLLWNTVRDDGVQEPFRKLAVDAMFGSVRPGFHLWYLYAYVPCLLLLGCAALMRARQPVRRAALLLLVLAVLPTCGQPVSELTGWDMPAVGWGFAFYQIAYAVGGAVLLSLSSVRWRWVWLPVALAAAGAVLWWERDLHFPSPYGTAPVALLSISVVMLFCRLRVPERARPLLVRLSDASFGAYLVHLLLLQATADRMLPVPRGGLSAVVFLLLTAAGVAAVAYALSLLWGRLGLRRLLG